jgi:hypothetical protein
MASWSMSTPGGGDPLDRSPRLLIVEARLAASYIERASVWAADIDEEIASELMALHRRLLQRIAGLERFRPRS